MYANMAYCFAKYFAVSCCFICTYWGGYAPLFAQNLPDANGQVRSIIPDGSGGLFIGGGFSVLTEKPSGTQVSRPGLAHILPSGLVDRAWNPTIIDGFAPNPSSVIIKALAMENGILYLAGSFSYINGVPRFGLASINAASGTLTSWYPNEFMGTTNPFYQGFGRLTENLVATNNRIYCVGFKESEPQFYGVGIFDASNNTPLALANSGEALSLAVGNGVVYVGRQGSIRAYDAASGMILPRFATNDGLSYGFRVTALAVYGDKLFVGGSLLDENALPQYVYRNLVALNAATGRILPMNISANQIVYSLAINNDILYVGGGFTAVNGQPRTYAAALNPNDGSLLPFAPAIQGDVNPMVNAFAFQNDIVYMGGIFATVGGQPANSLSGSASASVIPPADPVAAINFTNQAQNGTGYTVSWVPPTNAPAGYTVVAVEGTAPATGSPQNGESYAANPLFTATPTPPFSGQVVYDGTGTSVNITGLMPNTNYTFLVYSFNGSGITTRTYGASASATGRTNDITPPAVVLHPGILTVSSATINFGDVALNTSRTRRYTMHCYNLTTASVSITPPAQCEISVGGAPFTASPVIFTTRATIDQVDIRLRFSPSANGALAGSVTHTAGSTNAVATVSGASSPPSISTSTLSLNFGAVAPSSTATMAYRVNYRNLTTRTITITPPTGFAVSLTGNAPFSTTPLTVPTNVSGRFNVYTQFSPATVGIKNGMLQNSNPEVPTINLIVEGEGEYPQVDLNTYSLDFGGVPVGTCKTLSYVVFPIGGIGSQLTSICPDPSGDMQISLVGPNGPFSSACQSVFFSRVNGRRSAQVWVRYCPSSTNDLSAVIRHTSSEPSAPSIELAVAGKGVRPEIEILNPTTVNFGTINTVLI